MSAAIRAPRAHPAAPTATSALADQFDDVPRYLMATRADGTCCWVPLRPDGSEPNHVWGLREALPADVTWSYTRTTQSPD